MLFTKKQIAEIQESIREDLRQVSEEDSKYVYKAWKKMLSIIASHEKVLTTIGEVSTELWLAEDRGVVTISAKEIIAKLEGKS